MYWYYRISPVLALLFIGLGLFLHLRIGILSGLPLYVGALFIVLVYLLFGNIWQAFGKLKQGNLEAAEAILQDIAYPKILFKTHRAYYHFIQGILHIKKENLRDGETHLLQALQLGVTNATDRALITLNLGSLYLQTQNLEQAKYYIQETLRSSSNDLILKQRAAVFERKIKELYPE
jgi:tetratricopeptide (TPR) repeat protein